MWVSRALCPLSGESDESRRHSSFSAPCASRAGAEAQSQLTPSTPRGHTAMLPDHLAVGTVTYGHTKQAREVLCHKRRTCGLLGRAARPAGDRDEVDAVPVASPVREVVTEVRPRHGHRLAVLEHSRVLPHNLLVAEGGPAVQVGLGQEFVHGAADRSAEQRLARDGVVEGGRLCAAHFLEKVGLLPVAAKLGEAAVVVGDPIGVLDVNVPPEVSLHGSRASTVRFWCHYALVSLYRRAADNEIAGGGGRPNRQCGPECGRQDGTARQ
mmetsp:Transcript_15564/g.51781  ORF Transcript_15564/g.51781 Transcript_15564/m.51781 type:complete len:268 (-) Transcript_15564:93-896(-)